ncbi:hypothetical protein IWX65_002910 [Arthrobacter sp. CAN_A214]|uniref:hypothetical protein n=1 Tax=Arthrobacter sp. CAN_A214 TaxID=2787720 RepID=UPI0018CA7800
MVSSAPGATSGRSPARNGRGSLAASPAAGLSRQAQAALAVLRVLLGSVFLWAFLDKTFGFGLATPADKA